MSKKFAKVQNYYTAGLWSIARVKKAVTCGWITPEEFMEITGEEYEAEAA